ncbi:ABC transporter substrate-binding protein [Zooshikella harenae]|uniref:ABC transporter substrate-binding protein n=1 Tax=Zooshikella harenae TaxID=2827238 RepID=A0ABS5ZAH2_9GAMM|nr:ABC transporter substrate-binding protein [Zooshikella harenae]MBU2711053.1 ABC transporter substrate-binding protein [Zooshikella harenae]
MIDYLLKYIISSPLYIFLLEAIVFFFLFFTFFNVSPLRAAHITPSVVFISFRTPDDAFWGPVENFMRAACNDLGMPLKVYYAHSKRENIVKYYLQAARDDHADVVLIGNFRKTAHHIIKRSSQEKTPVFLFNAGLSVDVASQMGPPRKNYPLWLGELLPDDEQAGYVLAKTLIEAARTQNPHRKATIVGISGINVSPASVARNKGLKRALFEYAGSAVLKQIVHANWEPDLAAQHFSTLYKRYPQVNIAWAASDLMSIGIINALPSVNPSLKPNKNFFTGGIDWAKQGLTYVQQGKMTASIGGHFMDGAWSVILLHDYFNGIDFADEHVSMRSQMNVITTENIGAYLHHFSGQQWDKIDFTIFSKYYNTDLQQYSFTLNEVMKQFSH